MTLEDEIKELRKLSPAEKIKRLKELEEASKKELEETDKLLKEAEREAISDQEKQQLPIPHMKAASPDTLETIEAKLLWAAKRNVSLTAASQPQQETPTAKPLEESVEEAQAKQQEAQAQYGTRIEEATASHTPPQYAQQAENPYDTVTQPQKTSVTYQKPEFSTEATYEHRKATPGHETEKIEEFYTQAKKKKTVY
ncbi:hypothetical protein HY640_02630 [Candidatus Woesearchaeota archaeon]|nr:hypothetical protein [Candidatus Woesearchaeota archaeon]